MPVSEAQRFAMHTQLRQVMGEEVADTMMEYMPPFGWADVARKSDIDRLDQRLDHVDQRLDQIDKRFEQIDKRFEQVDKRFEQVDKRFDQIDNRFGQIDMRFGQVDKRFSGLVGGMWALGSIMATGFFGLFALIVTKL